MALNIIQHHATSFKQYGVPRSAILDSVEVHSIGCAQNTIQPIFDGMNQYKPGGITHAICAADIPDTVWQVLPDGNTCWADAGYGNQHSFTFEIAESDHMRYTGGANFVITNQAKFLEDVKRGYNTGVKYAAYICRKFGFNPTDKLPNGLCRVYSHNEGRIKGLSSAHVDPTHLWQAPGSIGKSMDDFRADVIRVMNGDEEIFSEPKWYRVGTGWENGKCINQVEADIELENAKKTADKYYGYKVYDHEGNLVYTSAAPEPTPGQYPSGKPASKEAYIEACGAIARELMKETKILASVVTAQCCLETGFGLGSDSTPLVAVNNLLGMKTDLINSTWQQYTVWSGESITKRTPEYHNGKLVYINDSFRKYTNYENCIRDYEMFLLYVQNNKGYKYRRVAGMTDAAAAIHAIRIGTGTSANPEGYCTDPAYEGKILQLIKDYNLDRFNTDADPDPTPVPEPTPAPAPEPTPISKKQYKVQVGAFKNQTYAAARLQLAQQKITDKAFCRLEEDGLYHVQVGSFDSKENAERMAAEIQKKKICSASVEEYDA